MEFDKILSEINGFGKFQKLLFLIQTFSRITLPCHFLLNNFMAAVPPHHCNVTALKDVFWNLTEEQLLAVGIPAERDGTLSSCHMFLEPQNQGPGWNSSEGAEILPCQDGWVYDHGTFRSTLATEWDLVCNRKWMNKATATIFFVGVTIGAPLFGFLSDRFGRRKVLLASYLSTMLFALLSAFSVSYIMFVIMRFFTGLSIAGISIISSILNVEWVSVHHRTLSALLMGLDGTVGTWIMVGFAYGLSEWRMLILAVTSPLLPSVVLWWWLPESARWLLANGKTRDAHQYIKKCAKMNNKEKNMEKITLETLLDEKAKEENDNSKDKKYTFIDIFRTPKMRKLSIYLGLVWFGAELTYYGISLNIDNFGLNLYLTQFIFASMEVPMKISVFFLLNKLGRKPSEMGALFLTAVFLVINMFVPIDQAGARTSVAVIGKAVSEASCTIMYLYTAELYPTVVRQNGVGYTALIARLGVSISPLVRLLEDVWYLLPAVTYSTVAVIAGLVASRFNETLNAKLPETIDDIEKPKRKEKVFMHSVRLATAGDID